jgi:putative MFS transporter
MNAQTRRVKPYDGLGKESLLQIVVKCTKADAMPRFHLSFNDDASGPKRMPEALVRLDSLPITRLHVLAGFACAFAFAADVMDLAVGRALTAVFAAPPYEMDPHRLGWLISSVYGGAVLGAPALGWLADRFGARPIITAALVWLGLTSLATAASANINWVLSFRFLSGLALGALPPIIIAYLAAIAPARYRGLYIFWVAAISLLAAPATIFTVRWLTPIQPFGVEGWRWPFAIAGVLAVGASAVLARLPESPRWLIQVGRHSDADAVNSRFENSAKVWGRRRLASDELPSNPPAAVNNIRTFVTSSSKVSFKGRLIFLATLYFLAPWASLGFSLLTGPVLLERGYDLTNTLLFVGIGTFGPTISTLFAGVLIDRVERRTALVFCDLLMLAAAFLFFNQTGVLWLTTSVIVFGTCSAFYVPLMSTYGAEIFTSRVRSSATSSAWAISRIAGVAVPIVLLPMLHQGGAQSAAKCIYVVLVLSIALVLILGPRGATARPVD